MVSSIKIGPTRYCLPIAHNMVHFAGWSDVSMTMRGCSEAQTPCSARSRNHQGGNVLHHWTVGSLRWCCSLGYKFATLPHPVIPFTFPIKELFSKCCVSYQYPSYISN
jgi:hypothetical protein